MKKLYVVVPCYNEEEVLNETTKRLKEKFLKLIKLNQIDKNSRILYVNDGSKDKTWELIKKIHDEDKTFSGLCLSRNRGHQNALLAGLMYAKEKADIIISMDADLQDDINAIDIMIEKHNQGCEIVYGVRSARKTDTWFKKTTAEGFYKFMKKMGVDIVYNHADYRLASSKVLNQLEKYHETNLFLRGIFPLIGYKTDIVYYERNERFAGESKYPLKKMLNFAWDGITSFSVNPLRLIFKTGLFFTILNVMGLIALLVMFLCNIDFAMMWYYTAITFLAVGIVLFAMGIVGEYIGKIYGEVKNRPRFNVSETIDEE